MKIFKLAFKHGFDVFRLMMGVPELSSDPIFLTVMIFEEFSKSLAYLNLVLIHMSTVDVSISLVQSL